MERTMEPLALYNELESAIENYVDWMKDKALDYLDDDAWYAIDEKADSFYELARDFRKCYSETTEDLLAYCKEVLAEDKHYKLKSIVTEMDKRETHIQGLMYELREATNQPSTSKDASSSSQKDPAGEDTEGTVVACSSVCHQ